MIELIETQNSNLSSIDMLFGDLPLFYWATIESDTVPWSLFKKVKKSLDKGDKQEAVNTLKEIIDMPGLESRQYLQAYHFLNGIQEFDEREIQLFGVIAEIGLEQGSDTLAVYADHRARYYNYSGKSIIRENADDSLDALIDGILLQGTAIVSKIGPWQVARPAAPGNGKARINFLTSHGLHFGEASQSDLFSDPLAGKVMFALLEVMKRLTDQADAAKLERVLSTGTEYLNQHLSEK